jgi:hypothetical protein
MRLKFSKPVGPVFAYEAPGTYIHTYIHSFFEAFRYFSQVHTITMRIKFLTSALQRLKA